MHIPKSTPPKIINSGFTSKKATAKNVIAIRAIDEAFLLLFCYIFINENASSAGTTGIIPEKNPSNILEFLVLE